MGLTLVAIMYMKYNYISLKNGVLFRTQQEYIWVATDGATAICAKTDDQLDGDVLIPSISGWTAIQDFDCCWDDVQATWKD